MTEPDTYELWQKVRDNRDYTSGTDYMIWHVDTGSVVDWFEDEAEAHEAYYQLIGGAFAQLQLEGDGFDEAF